MRNVLEKTNSCHMNMNINTLLPVYIEIPLTTFENKPELPLIHTATDFFQQQEVSIPVKPEEDKVSLVVKRGNLSTNKLWVLRKKCSKHAADAVAQSSGKVIQNNLWVVFCWFLSSSLNNKYRDKPWT